MRGRAQRRRDIRDADCKALAASIRRDLLAPFTLWNLGPEVAVPRLVPVLAERVDPGQRATVYEAAGRMGLTVKSQQIYEDLGLEMPAGVPETLVPATRTPDPFGAMLNGNPFSRQEAKDARPDKPESDDVQGVEDDGEQDEEDGTEQKK